MTIASTRLLTGHVLDRLRELPDESVHCCVTSPPYWGLRDYGTEPQVWDDIVRCDHKWGGEVVNPAMSGGIGTGIVGSHQDDRTHHKTRSTFCLHCNAWRGSLGLEPTPSLYVQHIVEIFREVRRILRKDGTCWIVIGDSYASTYNASQSLHTAAGWKQAGKSPNNQSGNGLKPKDLVGIPWMVAFALRDDGWWLRSEITWCKRAPMPESVTDRPTSATEKIFLLTKSENSFYDHIAIQENSVSNHKSGNGYKRDYRLSLNGRGQNNEWTDIGGKRNMRNFWLLSPEPTKEKHYAAYPSEIPNRAILAGTSEKGVCSQCGAPWERIIERSKHPTRDVEAQRLKSVLATGRKDGKTPGPEGMTDFVETIGWQPICNCQQANLTPATVLDLFLGSGTTAIVANQLLRNCIGIDLNTEYAAMALRRVGKDGLLYKAELT